MHGKITVNNANKYFIDKKNSINLLVILMFCYDIK